MTLEYEIEQNTHPVMSQYKITHSFKVFLALSAFFLAPISAAQVVISQPSLGFSKACASESFNTFDLNFSYSASGGLDPDNQFIIELSDAQGDFTTASTLFTSEPGEITSSPVSVTFSIPPDTFGEGYKTRVISTLPEAAGAPSQSFAAYYKVHDTPFSINDLVATATFCPGGGYLLTIDNPGNDGTISPLTFDTLNFNWFKEIDNTNSIWVAQGTSFETSEEGTYFAETDYGTCTTDSFSNRVTLSFAVDDEPATATITSSLGASFCSDGEGTTLTTIAGDSYQWFRNDIAIDGADGISIQTNQTGYYAVIVTIGECVAVGSIEIESLNSATSLNVPAVNFLELGESLEVIVSTTLDNPTFEWYVDNILIEGATGGSFTASQIGLYNVLIISDSPCNFIPELAFEIRQEAVATNIPNLISPNGDGHNDTWMIPSKYSQGTATEIMIVSSNGREVFQTKSYNNDWPTSAEDLQSESQVFYYSIAPPGEKTIVGSITIIR